MRSSRLKIANAIVDFEDIVGSFNRQHQQRFGFISDREIELVAVRMEGNKIGLRLPKTISIRSFTSPQSFTEQMVAIKNLETGHIDYQMTPVFDREILKAGDTVRGPGLIAGPLSTTMVEPAWKATMLNEGQLLLEKTG